MKGTWRFANLLSRNRFWLSPFVPREGESESAERENKERWAVFLSQQVHMFYKDKEKLVAGYGFNPQHENRFL